MNAIFCDQVVTTAVNEFIKSLMISFNTCLNFIIEYIKFVGRFAFAKCQRVPKDLVQF